VEAKLREWENKKMTIEPKLPEIKNKVFNNPPQQYALENDTLRFYEARLDEAMKGLFLPPPEGIEGAKIFITERSDLPETILHLLKTAPSGISGLVENCRKLEQLETEFKDLEYYIRQQNQNIKALSSGIGPRRTIIQKHAG
jgi:hypothetical protein